MKLPRTAGTVAKLLVCICLLHGWVSAQPAGSIGILPKKLSILTGNLDSLIRSYTKKGFTAEIGRRDPGGIFSDNIYLESGFVIELGAPAPGSLGSWQRQAVARFGAHTSALTFEVNDPDSLYKTLMRNGIACQVIGKETPDSASRIASFALDSCHPLDVVFERTARLPNRDARTKHPNGVYRLDWILLTCGDRVKQIVERVLTISGADKAHQGCCDYWHMGTGNDFTLTRFDPLTPKAGKDPYWFSIEADSFYWAY